MNYVPFVVPCLSTNSSTSCSSTSSTSSSQDTVISSENPATKRSEIMNKESRGNRRVDKQKPKTQIKMKTTKIYEENYCKMCRKWLQDFKEILVDKNFQSHQYSPSFFHEFPMESRAQAASNSVSTVSIHTSRRLKLSFLLEDENNKDFLTEDVLVQSCPEPKILMM